MQKLLASCAPDFYVMGSNPTKVWPLQPTCVQRNVNKARNSYHRLLSGFVQHVILHYPLVGRSIVLVCYRVIMRQMVLIDFLVFQPEADIPVSFCLCTLNYSDYITSYLCLDHLYVITTVRGGMVPSPSQQNIFIQHSGGPLMLPGRTRHRLPLYYYMTCLLIHHSSILGTTQRKQHCVCSVIMVVVCLSTGPDEVVLLVLQCKLYTYTASTDYSKTSPCQVHFALPTLWQFRITVNALVYLAAMYIIDATISS